MPSLPGAISNRKLEEAEEILRSVDSASLRALVKEARDLQRKCNHKGWKRSDNLYLECGTCGAPLTYDHKPFFAKED